MFSSALPSVLYQRDAAGMLKLAWDRTSTLVMHRVSTNGDAVHDFEEHCIGTISTVCDGQRSDAFVTTQTVGVDALYEIVDGTLDTLIRHLREMVFQLPEHASKELFRHYCRLLQDRCHDNEEKA